MEDNKAILEKESYKSWMTYMYLRSSDQRKYGSLMKGWTTQYSQGSDQYPKTFVKAVDILTNHRFDEGFAKHKNKEKTENKDKRRNKEKDGNEENKEHGRSFAQKGSNDKFCYCCGDKNHLSNNCPVRDKTNRSDWVVNKGMQHLQSENKDEAKDDSESARSSITNDTSGVNQKVGWSGLQASFMSSEIVSIREKMLLDNGLLMSLFQNRKLVTGIMKSTQKLEMATNAGVQMCDMKAHVPGFGEVGYNEEAIMNIFSLPDMIKQYRVTFDLHLWCISTKTGLNVMRMACISSRQVRSS